MENEIIDPNLIQNPMEDVEMSSSESDNSDDIPQKFFAGYEDILNEDEDLAGDEGLVMDYHRLAEAEGLPYTIKSVPIGSKITPFAQTIGFVEKLLLMKPLDPSEIVDVDTIVVRAEDLQVLGKILEVFGPVEAPLYSVLCHEEYLGKVPEGLTVHFMPDQASIVQTAVLRAQKCTDADEEGGDGEEFYSDDEAEAAARKNKRSTKRKAADLEPGEIE